jgi:23S rRNA pseudouridine1911/1915/1917 synthase
LIEVEPKTGRKHQIRTHFAYLGHPIAGDKLYGFKGQMKPKNLKRQFLHASYLKIKLPNNKIMEFKSELPEDLKSCLPTN